MDNKVQSNSYAKANFILKEAQTKADSIIKEANSNAEIIHNNALQQCDTLLSQAHLQSKSIIDDAIRRVDSIKESLYEYASTLGVDPLKLTFIISDSQNLYTDKLFFADSNDFRLIVSDAFSSAKADADSYVLLKHKEADSYYLSKKHDADVLLSDAKSKANVDSIIASAHSEASSILLQAKNTATATSAQIISDAHNKASLIISEANQKAADILSHSTSSDVVSSSLPFVKSSLENTSLASSNLPIVSHFSSSDSVIDLSSHDSSFVNNSLTESSVLTSYVFDIFYTDYTNSRSWIDFNSFSFIVKTYVSTDYRRIKLICYKTHSFNSCFELP